MVEYTVGVASALIAAGVAILQFVLPNALALVLTGSLSESHSAVTWSVVSRFILSSDWPLFLRSDHVATQSVGRKISLVTWMKPLGLILAAIAAVVTPLGLYDDILPSSTPTTTKFVYVADQSAFGSGTPSRSKLGFSRSCWNVLCPGEPQLGNVTLLTANYTGNLSYEYIYESTIIKSPSLVEDFVDVYQSGLDDSMASVSGFFDIQYRQWNTQTSNETVNNSSYIVPAWKFLTSMITENDYKMLDGLIVDYANGGIGFRNHSVPVGSQFGSEWEEDIMWWTPDVQCVPLNTSIFYQSKSKDGYSSVSGVVDRGGFVNLDPESPVPVNGTPFTEGQENPQLFERANYAAWASNLIVMQFLNISEPKTKLARLDSKLGQRFEVNASTWFKPTLLEDAGYLDRSRYLDLVDLPMSMPNDSTSNTKIPNPWNITGNFTRYLRNDCKSSYSDAQVNISTLSIEISLIAAPAHQTEGDATTDIRALNTTWERPIYACAGATKASIKTFRFRYNATRENNLNGLYIVDVKDKKYESPSKMPIWAVEDPEPSWNASDVSPVWGIVSEAKSRGQNISVIQRDHLYLPGGPDWYAGSNLPLAGYTSVSDNLPATVGSTMLWSATMHSETSGFLYSGQDNLPLLLLWRDLTQNATGTSKALRLIWTDYATNFLVGTKGIHTPRHTQPPTLTQNKRQVNTDSTEGEYPVYILSHQLRYRWIFAIPALICIAVVGTALVMAIIAWMCGHGTMARLRYFMFSISSGRILASTTYNDTLVNRQADTKEWIENIGHKPVAISARSTALAYPQYMGDAKAPQYIQVNQQDEDFRARQI